MANVITLLSGAALGAGTMYLMDPDRGHRRRADLRERLAEAGDSEMLDRARRLEPLTAVREIGTGILASRWPGLGVSRSRGRVVRLRRGGTSALQPRDWALLGGFAAAIAAGLWRLRRSRGAGGGIEVVRTLTVEAPVERVYEFWNDFENFPRFMSHVREVRRTGPDRTHWVVNGPGGAPIEWDAVVTRRVPSEEIGWRTVESSLVEHEGTVRFRRAGPNATRIEVGLTYRPVGGALGHGLAALFGSDPERVIADDLARVAAQLHAARPAVGETGQSR
ncbi:MAG TPA: SRPBCC family protein [Methylomirabilota bacterium]|nr:SRPBCC family protein [Methylomirabilota bacterium]